MSIIATAQVAAPYRLDQVDTETFPRITICPAGNVWCRTHHVDPDDAPGTYMCVGETVLIKTAIEREHAEIAVNSCHLMYPEGGYDERTVHLEAADCDLTPLQALRLAAVLTERATQLLASERAR